MPRQVASWLSPKRRIVHRKFGNRLKFLPVQAGREFFCFPVQAADGKAATRGCRDRVRTRFAEAASALEQKSYFSRFENDSIALNNLGVLHKHLGKEAEAEKFFKRSIELNPALKQAQKNLQLLIN